MRKSVKMVLAVLTAMALAAASLALLSGCKSEEEKLKDRLAAILEDDVESTLLTHYVVTGSNARVDGYEIAWAIPDGTTTIDRYTEGKAINSPEDHDYRCTYEVEGTIQFQIGGGRTITKPISAVIYIYPNHSSDEVQSKVYDWSVN